MGNVNQNRTGETPQQTRNTLIRHHNRHFALRIYNPVSCPSQSPVFDSISIGVDTGSINFNASIQKSKNETFRCIRCVCGDGGIVLGHRTGWHFAQNPRSVYKSTRIVASLWTIMRHRMRNTQWTMPGGVFPLSRRLLLQCRICQKQQRRVCAEETVSTKITKNHTNIYCVEF